MYSFMSALPVYADPFQDSYDFSEMTIDQQAAMRKILATISSQFNITFHEIGDTAPHMASFVSVITSKRQLADLNPAAPGALSSAGLTSGHQAAIDNLSMGLTTVIENTSAVPAAIRWSV